MDSFDQFEHFVYESKPFAVLAIAIYALSAERPNSFLITCACILLFCGTFLLRLRLKHRRGSPIETLFYESQPYFYLGLGLYTLFFKNQSKFAAGCALLLVFCGTMIMRWRYKNRHN
jgi:drug/metabolite transporter (DMT)-like permease